MKTILKVENLRTYFDVKAGVAKVVNGLSFEVKEGHLLGVIGESGSGKSVAASSIMGKVRKPGRIAGGKVLFNEKIDMVALPDCELRKYRGNEISLIAANARGHLNPLLTVGQQIVNTYRAHNKGAKKKEAIDIAIDMLKAVGITDPQQRVKAYPHELSGGMAQRCMIALALVNSPKMLIADDATNGLDVTVQAQIMDLILEKMNQRGMSGIFVTHDLGVVAQCCQEIAIMYCGQIVEYSSVASFYRQPLHPYSINLLQSLPENLGGHDRNSTWSFLPNPLMLPTGCLYHPRCKHATGLCKQEEPAMCAVSGERQVKCHYAKEFVGKGKVSDATSS